MPETIDKAYALIAAAGSGTRMGGDIPKQFMAVDGKPMVVRVLETFVSSKLIDGIVVAAPVDYITELDELIKKSLPKDCARIHIVAGGAHRNATLIEGCKFIRDELGAAADDIIVSHDAARPWARESLISACITALSQDAPGIWCAADAVTCAIPAVDTIAFADELGLIGSIPDRRICYNVQTPQAFRLRTFFDVIDHMSEYDIKRYTDVGGIFIAAGKKVALVPGSRSNIKITVPEDLEG